MAFKEQLKYGLMWKRCIKNYRNKIAIAFFIFHIVQLSACSSESPRQDVLTQNQLKSGEHLARRYCSGCHETPAPGLLDKSTWQKSVLPAMGKRLGIDDWNGLVTQKEGAALTAKQWESIKAFYLTICPIKLKKAVPTAPPINDWAIFKLEKLSANQVKASSQTTLTTWDSISASLYTSGADSNLCRWDKSMTCRDVIKLPSPATSALFSKGHGGSVVAVLSCIGSLLPSNDQSGKIMMYLLKNGKALKKQVMADSLPRPVNIAAGDFNKDGLTDYAVCAFGHDNGGLYLLRQNSSKTFRKELIRGMPGAIQAVVTDINHDGWPDIVCLFAQADEGIWAFINNRKGGFSTENIIRFPPVYGSNSFQLTDVDHDGDLDIVYTAGDNGDYSPILKPYHGVYIYLNDGKFRFSKKYFYPLNGCSKAIAADFDHDGDEDIAIIAFFADFQGHHPQGMLYLEQIKTLQFKPHELPIGKLGRWLVMDVNDYNDDGYADIALGNFMTGMAGGTNPPVSGKVSPYILLANQAGQNVKR